MFAWRHLHSPRPTQVTERHRRVVMRWSNVLLGPVLLFAATPGAFGATETGLELLSACEEYLENAKHTGGASTYVMTPGAAQCSGFFSAAGQLSGLIALDEASRHCVPAGVG